MYVAASTVRFSSVFLSYRSSIFILLVVMSRKLIVSTSQYG